MAMSSQSLLPFALFVLAIDVWIILVVILLPRILGRALAFFANRAHSDHLHLVISSLYIYPLAGKAVAYSVRYTVPNGTIAIEQLILQIRWWRRTPVFDFNQTLLVDQPATLDPVATAQQKLQQENASFFIKRTFYRLRRWWHHTAVVKDLNTSIEPAPLISVICIGLRARMVNYQSNYNLVNHVLQLSTPTPPHSSTSSTSRHSLQSNRTAPQHPTSPHQTHSDSINYPSTSSPSDISLTSLREKPFIDSIFELTSVRISDGAFYFCDMGESPLLRISMKSAKFRYMYGTPACSIDKCRKRLRIRVSGFKLSVSHLSSVKNVIYPTISSRFDSSDAPTTPAAAKTDDKTDQLIRRVVSDGHKAFSQPICDTESSPNCHQPSSGREKNQLRQSIRLKLPHISKKKRPILRRARTESSLACSDVLEADTAVVDYVFDEPGVERAERRESLSGDASTAPNVDVEKQDEPSHNPAPVCRVSILMRGTSFSYDMEAIANIEQVVERLQPSFYDLIPVARELHSKEGRRAATGIQIEIDAFPEVHNQSEQPSTQSTPFIMVPFKPRKSTWKALEALKVGEWNSKRQGERGAEEEKPQNFPPASKLLIAVSKMSLRTEIPYEYGASQKTVVTLKDVRIRVQGIVNMPFFDSKLVTATRVVQTPSVWNEEHVVAVDIFTSDANVNFLPDVARVVDDVSSTFKDLSRKPQSIRYFVPYRQKTKIRAEKYNVSLACSRDNVWRDVANGTSDRYGKVKICGHNGELAFIPVAFSSYVPDSFEMGWYLSIPNAVGMMCLDLSEIHPSASKDKRKAEQPGSILRNLSFYQKSRVPSLAHRLFTQGDTLNAEQPGGSISKVPGKPRTTVERTFLRFGPVCYLSGKVVLHEPRFFLGGSKHAFLDSVNRTNINLQCSYLAADLNPHHITNILNIVKNYSNGGLHTISSEEKTEILRKRKDIAARILSKPRYPNAEECMTLGLNSGLVMSAADHRTATDDLFNVHFEIDYLVVRTHALPHSAAPFSNTPERVCSFVYENVDALVCGNMLGSKLVSNRNNSKSRLYLYGGYLPFHQSPATEKEASFARKSEIPKATFIQPRITKHSQASPVYGPYYTNLLIHVDEMNGCVMDYSVRSLSQFFASIDYESLGDNQIAIASLLYVDNYHIDVSRGDIYILSPASSTSIRRSGMQCNVASSVIARNAKKVPTTAKPRHIQAITRIKFSQGLRCVASSLATEKLASRTRLLVPQINATVIIPWGEDRPPWIDEATMAAQVSHASSLGTELPPNAFDKTGVMRQVCDVENVIIDLFMESRPALWSSRIEKFQKTHLTSLFETFGYVLPEWTSETPLVRRADILREDEHNVMYEEWWKFVTTAKAPSLISREEVCTVPEASRTDCISVKILRPVEARLAAECLEVFNDILMRLQESCRSRSSVFKAAEGEERNSDQSEKILSLWDKYENSKQDKIPSAALSNSLPTLITSVFECNSLCLHLYAPIMDDNHEEESITNFRGFNNTLVVSVPRGLRFFKSSTLTFQRGLTSHVNTVLRGSSSRSLPKKLTFAGCTSFSAPLIVLRCTQHEQGSDELGHLKDVIIISREKWNTSNDLSPFDRNVESHCVVGKVSSAVLGSVSSSLAAYTAFGRIASIFFLMLRTLQLKHLVLKELETTSINNVCQERFSSSFSEFMGRSINNVYQCFINEQSILSDQEPVLPEQVSASHPKLLSGNPSGSNELPSTAPTVKSLDLNARNVSLKISGQEMLHVDIFLCKGRSNALLGDSRHSRSDEYIFKSAFGSVTLSMIDSIAADALRMVSDVASFAGRATFFIPLLRYDIDQDTNQANKSPVLSPTAQYKRGDRALSHFQNANRTRLSGSRHGRKKYNHRQGVHSARSPVYLHRQSSSRQALAFYNQRKFSGIAAPEQSYSSDAAYSLPQQRPIENKTLQITGGKVGGANITESEPPNSFNPTKVLQSNSRRTPFKDPSNASRIWPSSSHEKRKFPSVADLSKDDAYQIVAVTTAVESGPPRKKARRMIRKMVIPPAFQLSEIQKKKTLSQNARDTAMDKLSISVSSNSARQSGKSSVRKACIEERRASQSHRHLEKRSSHVSKHQGSSFENPFPSATMFFSCRELVFQYYRGRGMYRRVQTGCKKSHGADVRFVLNQPRLTVMSSSKGMCSIVLTLSSASLQSPNDPSCILTGEISRVGIKISIAQGVVPPRPPKLIVSCRVRELVATLHAKDLQSVLKFREGFKNDLKSVLGAFVTTKRSIWEMSRATKSIMSTSIPRKTPLYSTLSVDLLLEDSKVVLKGFHPKDTSLSVTYLLDGMFFSAVASEADSAALTLGLRLYGHGLRLEAHVWGSAELLLFPSLDARGVQWSESIGLPTLLKVTAEPLRNSTSVHGLRHILFTVSGLLAFQNLPTHSSERPLHERDQVREPEPHQASTAEPNSAWEGTLLARSLAAWERTKGVRMELSIRPMSLSLVSGQTVALFHLQAVTGIFEWNKLVTSGVQLHTVVSIPKMSLSVMRMPSIDFTAQDIQPDDRRTSLSFALERSRVDVLKSQEDLTHNFTFRIVVYAVSGKLHPWRLLQDAAAWADEQEFVSDIQFMNYNSLSSGRQRQSKTSVPHADVEHRVILIGISVQRFKLAIPLLGSEGYSSSRLALSASELHLSAQHRCQGPDISLRNVIQVKSNFVGVFWQSSSLLSSHHARIVLAVHRQSREGHSIFGPTSIVVVPGTWMVCPRKEFVIAVLEAKNIKENKNISEMTREIMASLPDITSKTGSSAAGYSTSNLTEGQDRLLMESLKLKITRTSGFIEGLESVHESNLSKEQKYSSTPSASKMSVPAFSVSVTRDARHNFDLIDIDFSEREGVFPKGCLQKLSNLSTEIFGAVAGQDTSQSDSFSQQSQRQSQERKLSRDVSVVVRFGESLYRAQEEMNLSFDSKLGFFAGKHSALLLSATTAPVFGNEETHTTVYTWISSNLKLEITPMLDGARPQSLRLSDARLLHGISPCYSPHSLLHLNKVSAAVEAKTLLLAERRHRANLSSKAQDNDADSHFKTSISSIEESERNFVVFLGRAYNSRRNTKQERKGSKPNIISSSQPSASDQSGTVLEDVEKSTTLQHSKDIPSSYKADIRIQLKFGSTPDTEGNQMDLFLVRMLLGVSSRRETASVGLPHCHNLYWILHKGMLKAQWEFLSCNLSVEENVSDFFAVGEASQCEKWVCTKNITNRLNFEVLRYENHTLKLGIDAIALACSALPYTVIIESTDIRTEVSHTLLQAIARMLGLLKKLKNEVQLLFERHMAQDSNQIESSQSSFTPGRAMGTDNQVSENVLDDSLLRGEVGPAISSSEFALVLRRSSEVLLSRGGTTVAIKGTGLEITLRGYQFDERRHSGLISLSNYNLRHEHGNAANREYARDRNMELNFEMVKLSYRDDERQIHTDLFYVPSPSLVLHVTDNLETFALDLKGNLDVKLGSGFYNWRDFKELASLTFNGISAPSSQDSSLNRDDVSPAMDLNAWNGKKPIITVDLNPRIDVIGDFTSDVLQRLESRLGSGDDIPRYMYHHILLPLEALAKALCEPLLEYRV